jgi:hypothetical protein
MEEPLQEKICRVCGISQPTSRYVFYKRTKNHSSRCRTCDKIYFKDHYEKVGKERRKIYWKSYYKKNKPKIQAKGPRSRFPDGSTHYSRLKLRVISEYGGKCAYCGCSTAQFLCIDHIYDDGAEHRRQIGRGKICSYLKKHNFPKDRYQLLCHNCNSAKQFSKLNRDEIRELHRIGGTLVDDEVVNNNQNQQKWKSTDQGMEAAVQSPQGP